MKKQSKQTKQEKQNNNKKSKTIKQKNKTTPKETSNSLSLF